MSNPHGRLPAFEPTVDQRELVAILSGNGIPQPTICKFVKSPDTGEAISTSTLKKHFKVELIEGRNHSDAKLIESAYKAAIGGNVTMLIFLCKTRLGWKEPAQEINLRQTYEELVRDAAKKAEDQRKAGGAALTVVQGSKAA
jgi:hypothetical protein